MNVPTGADGATGPTGPAVTASNMHAANTTAGNLSIVVEGTAIPLPDNQDLNNFTVDADNTSFTPATDGTYLIFYRISTTVALPADGSSGVTRNGTLIPASQLTGSTDSYSISFITTLAAGDVLQLQLSGVAATAALLGGAGAYLTILRANN